MSTLHYVSIIKRKLQSTMSKSFRRPLTSSALPTFPTSSLGPNKTAKFCKNMNYLLNIGCQANLRVKKIITITQRRSYMHLTTHFFFWRNSRIYIVRTICTDTYVCVLFVSYGTTAIAITSKELQTEHTLMSLRWALIVFRRNCLNAYRFVRSMLFLLSFRIFRGIALSVMAS